MFNACEILI